MDLTTSYLGMKLRSPLVPSASPLSERVDNIRLMEDSGAGAAVLHSLFEEQIRADHFEFHHYTTFGAESHPEALTYVPEPAEFKIGPEEYLTHVANAKKAVSMPIIASLNGSTVGGWIDFARQIQEAGADALELNIYSIPTDPGVSAETIETTVIDILRAVKSVVSIPVAVKLSPFYTNFTAMAHRLEGAGADALVLFNRFYQPDIELESLEVRPNILLSTPMAMRLPLRWIGILHGRVGTGLAATSGIHRATDALKMFMAGADVAMLCSVLMRRGIAHLSVIEREIRQWMDEHEYESISQMRGSMSQQHCPDPGSFERAQYIQALSSTDFRS